MDKGHATTEKQLLTMEKKLTGIYSRANKEIGKKLKKYLEEQEKKGDALLDAVKEAKTAEERAEAEKAYKAFLTRKTVQSERFKALSEQYAKELLRVNETATDYINGRMPEVYSLNYNAVGGDISSKVKGYSFELVDASTVKSLATKDETLLPYKTVDGKKDVRWNTKAVNSEIMQGILQGESIPDMAKRLTNVTEMNLSSAIRNARTSTTAAQNRGRMDSYHRAEDMGIRLLKVWMATNDPRTREEHLELDGQEREVDEPFENSLGEIMYPGDPDADPANVYNCRCTLVTKILGFTEQQDYVPDFYEMEQEEYLDWQKDNSTYSVLDNQFEEKYGVSLKDASLGREDEWLDDKKMWLSDIAQEYTDDLLQVQNGYGHCGYIQAADGSKAINAYLRRGEVDLYTKAEMEKTIDAMDRLIASTSLKEDLWVDRCAGIDAIERMGINAGEHGKSFRIGHAFCTEDVDFNKIAKEINQDYVGSVLVDKGFMSASASPASNIFGGSDVTFTILAPKGTNAFISDNTRESELVFSHGTEQKIIGARVTEREATDYDGKKTTRETLEIFLKIVK